MKRFEVNQNINIRFGARTRFSPRVKLKPAAPFRGAPEAALERLKARLLGEALALNVDPDFDGALRRAANEAAALAWATWYPLLVFPGLFEEKAHSAARQAFRQAELRQESLAWLESA